MKIYILYTGGTIGCVGKPLTPMNGTDFAEAFNLHVTPTILRKLPQPSSVTVDSFQKTLDSANMQPVEWVQMSQRIIKNYEHYDAFLVLHGTDTLAWTSSALSFMLPGLSKTVTVTGSQLPLFVRQENQPCEILYNSDAVRNVLGAISFFTMDVPEVCIYFADKLYRGNRVVKSNSSAFAAFSSPNYPCLGEYGVIPILHRENILRVPDNQSLCLSHNLKKVREMLDTIEKNISKSSVLQLQTFPGNFCSHENKSLLSSMLSNLRYVSPTLKGIVFESYGIGNIPSFDCIQQQLRNMHQDDGIILVDCTQVFAGCVDYTEYEAGAWLGDAGVLSGQDMTAQAAMSKLTILLAAYPDKKQHEIEALMGKSIAGEMRVYYGLYGYKNEELTPGETLRSINGRFELENQAEGYVKLWQNTEKGDRIEVWSIGDSTPGKLKLQNDNDLVFYDKKNRVRWRSGTARQGVSSILKLDDDGCLKLYDIDNDEMVAVIFNNLEHSRDAHSLTYGSTQKSEIIDITQESEVEKLLTYG